VTENTQAWRQHGAPLIIILGGIALRLYRLGADSLWYDETVSAHLASKSIPDLIAHTALDIHPPGYYVLLHIWTQLAGDTEFALAFFSLVFGVLLIPLTYTLARRLLGRAGALWATLLVAISPFNLWYSQEVRMYTLGAALGLVTLWCTLKITNQQISKSANQQTTAAMKQGCIVGYILAATVGLYVLYYFGFLLVTLNLLMIGYLLWNRRFRILGTWLLAQVAVLIFYLPWLPIAWRQATNPPVPPWRGFIPFHKVLLEAWTALSLGQSVQPSQVWPILLVTGVLFLLALRSQHYQSTNLPIHQSTNLPIYQSTILLVAYTFAPLLLIYLASLITPLYHVRYVFTYAPAFYILLGAGLAWLSRRVWPLAVAAILALLIGSAFSVYELHTNPRYAADDFRAAIGYIAERWRPGDAVLINAGYAYPGFLYYYEHPIAGRLRLTDFQPAEAPSTSPPAGPLLLSTGTIDGAPDLGWGDPESDFYATTQAETAANLERVTQTFPRIWMLRIYDTVTDPQGFIRDWLATNTTPFEDQLFTGESFMRVQGFMSSTQPSPPSKAEIVLEGGISLLGWKVEPTAQAGEPLDVMLWWRAASDQGSATPYAVSLKLWGTSQTGEASLAAQQDEWPVGSLLLSPDWPPEQPIRHPMRLILPADLPPGDYWLEVEMYDPATVQPLPRQDGQGHTISLGLVTILPNR
jgi:mannosyltransferase